LVDKKSTLGDRWPSKWEQQGKDLPLPIQRKLNELLKAKSDRAQREASQETTKGEAAMDAVLRVRGGAHSSARAGDPHPAQQ